MNCIKALICASCYRPYVFSIRVSTGIPNFQVLINPGGKSFPRIRQLKAERVLFVEENPQVEQSLAVMNNAQKHLYLGDMTTPSE
jgi:hypothetical protein